MYLLNITPGEVRRLWDHVSAKATSIGKEPNIYFHEDKPPPESPGLTEAIERLLQGQDVIGVWPTLEGVRSHGEFLPDVTLELSRDAFGIYWWIGHPDDDWNPTTAAALTKLLWELRGFVPNARLQLEHSDDPLELWRPVEAYLAAEREPERE